MKKSTRFIKLSSIPAGWFLAGAVAIGALARFINIAKSSIWHDEGYTMMLEPQSVHDILMRTARDVHPPLYYIALHYWTGVFGMSETAARGFSAVCSLATIVVGYLLVKRLFNEPTARLAAVFLALGPFLVRYSQEARMYSMVALLMTVATYCLVRAVASRGWYWWAAYSLAIGAGLYTHYYSIFIILTHWIWMATTTGPGRGVRSKAWWISNIAAASLFLPWLPTAYHQFTRVQASFWIPKVNAYTLPNTLSQFLLYSDGFGRWIKVIMVTAFIGLMVSAIVTAVKQRRQLWLITLFTLVGPMAVFILSFKRPIYVDRYFVFAAVAFYMLAAIMILWAWPLRHRWWLQATLSTVVLALFVSGIRTVYITSNHQMRIIGQDVNQHFQPGDELVSGELYTYFDFTYYNHTGKLLKLLAPGGVNGYGESSLLYDRADQIVVKNYSQLHPSSGYVWVVGKTGTHSYFTNVPSTWHAIGPHYTAGYSATQEYLVSR